MGLLSRLKIVACCLNKLNLSIVQKKYNTIFKHEYFCTRQMEDFIKIIC